MGYRDDDDDREKKSWREIDKMRDRSDHRRGDGGRPRDRQETFLCSDYRKQQYMKKAGKLFGGKKKSSAQDQAAGVVVDAAGTKGFVAKADAYLKKYGPPDDWQALLVLLDHPDPDALERCADHLADRYESRSPAEQKMAVSKLRILSMTSKDPDVIEIARETLAKVE